MKNKIQDLEKFIKGKKIAVLGVGISNRPLLKFIYEMGGIVTAFDMSDENNADINAIINELKSEKVKIEWILGSDYLKSLSGFDIIFKTPKIRLDIPELINERKRGCIITSEMEVFMQFCPCEIIGVTGSDGKTTTTTMISLLLKKQGYNIHVGGNIGNPLLPEIKSINPKDIVIIELSSFQLHSMKTSPDRAVITNLSPNHLDVHRNFKEYIEAKSNIFLYQNILGKAVFNRKDKISRKIALKARGEVIWFSDKNEYIYYDKRRIYFSYTGKLDRKNVLIKGEHNLDNYCAAIACVRDLVSDDTILNVLKTFGGVEHRIELVRKINNISFYNSSIDSSPNRTKATLKTFIDEGINVILITGGKDKNSDYSGLGEEILKASDRIILCGENSHLIEKSIFDAINNNPEINEPEIYHAEDYETAVIEAYKIANPGEAVLLSPSGTSFDKFKNFEQRGNTFKRLVNKL